MLITMGLGIGTVYLIFETSRPRIIKTNGFTRRFAKSEMLEFKVVDLTYNSYYIAGNTKHSIFLGNSEAPRHLISANASLDTTHFTFVLNSTNEIIFRSIRVKVDSPYYYMMDGTIPIILRGSLCQRIVTPYPNIHDFFLEATPMGDSSFAIKSLLRPDNEMHLGQIKPGKRNASFSPEILTKQVDGIFCKEGMMEFDKWTKQIIYTYYYRNEFLLIGSDQSVKLQGHTIDTTSVAKIEIFKSRKTTGRTPATRPHLVNKTFSADRKYLYVNSVLISDNEDPHVFNENSVIDVYELANGLYKYSFYIPNYLNQKLVHFRVLKGVVIALFPRHLVSYRPAPSGSILKEQR